MTRSSLVLRSSRSTATATGTGVPIALTQQLAPPPWAVPTSEMHPCCSSLCRIRSRAISAAGGCSAAARRVSTNAVATQGFLGECPPHAQDTVQAIREAVAHSTCSPFAEIAREDTLVINPSWADVPRTTVRAWCPLHRRPSVARILSKCSLDLLGGRPCSEGGEVEGCPGLVRFRNRGTGGGSRCALACS